MRKVLVVGIIVLFLGVSYTSLGVEVNKNIEIESEEDSEIETLDYYNEIITWIWAEGNIHWIKRIGLFRGEAEIIPYSGTVNIQGWRLYFHQYGPDILYFDEEVNIVHAYRFLYFPILRPGRNFLGVAFGNIDWYKWR